MNTNQLWKQVPQSRFIFIIYMAIFIMLSGPTEQKSCSPSAKTLYVCVHVCINTACNSILQSPNKTE